MVDMIEMVDRVYHRLRHPSTAVPIATHNLKVTGDTLTEVLLTALHPMQVTGTEGHQATTVQLPH